MGRRAARPGRGAGRRDRRRGRARRRRAGSIPWPLCRRLERALGDDAIVVADGGDFVATASYVLRPRGPLAWLDPGAFGTLGVGAGFALGAKLVRPEADVWIVYGDGAAGYSLAEADTFVRHRLGVAALIGNDAGWTQIAREQVEVLHDAVGTALAPTDVRAGGAGPGRVRAEAVRGRRRGRRARRGARAWRAAAARPTSTRASAAPPSARARSRCEPARRAGVRAAPAA